MWARKKADFPIPYNTYEIVSKITNGVQASDAAEYMEYAKLRMPTLRHHRVTEVSEKHCLVNHIKRLMNRNSG